MLYGYDVYFATNNQQIIYMKTVYPGIKMLAVGLLGALLMTPMITMAQNQSRDQAKDQDRIDQPKQDQLRDQDCDQSGDCEPIQDRDQTRDQDRIQDPTAVNADGPDRTQLRTQTQDQDCVAGVDCEPIQAQDRDRDRLQVQTPDQLRNLIQEQQRQMQQGESEMADGVQQIYRNQNQVRVAVRALASSSEILGPIGPAVSRIAQDFDNSVQATIKVEEQIQNRSRLARVFFGSDDEQVESLSNNLSANQNRIRELNMLMDTWNGDPEVQTILREQIQNMEQEQVRLQQLVDDEADSRGLFGFLFGWL